MLMYYEKYWHKMPLNISTMYLSWFLKKILLIEHPNSSKMFKNQPVFRSYIQPSFGTFQTHFCKKWLQNILQINFPQKIPPSGNFYTPSEYVFIWEYIEFWALLWLTTSFQGCQKRQQQQTSQAPACSHFAEPQLEPFLKITQLLYASSR